MHLFVTVGTSRFDPLINLILENMTQLKQIYNKITIQSGHYKIPLNMDYDVFQFKDVINFSTYDVIITHCGTGSILGCLMQNKKIIAVINPELKDNHQHEAQHIFGNFIKIVNLNKLLFTLENKNYYLKLQRCKIRNTNYFLEDIIK